MGLKHKRSCAAAWVCAAVPVCGFGQAQAGAEPQSVEVTGSRIRAAQSEGATPVQVLTREDIARSGAGSLRELLDQLSASSGGTSDLGGSNSFAAGSSGASLRGLSKQATLVLLNSRRVAPYPLADYSEIFTNIDALPFEAIERIEVLKIGGAATYGSDAIAGVINVITRSGWRGVQARVSRQQSITSGRFGNTTASVTAGFGGQAPGDGHVLVNLELYRREALMWRDVLGYANPSVTSLSSGFGSLSTYSWPGNVIGAGPVPGCAPALLIGGLCRYDRYSRFEVVPEAQRSNLLVSAQQPLAGGRKLYAELLLADTRTHYRSALQAYGPKISVPIITWGNPRTNTAQEFVYRGLPAGHPLNTTGEDDAELRYRFVDGPNESTARTKQYRALLGLAGTTQGMDWDAAAGTMGGRTRFDERGWYSVSGFKEVIGNYDPNQTDPLFFNRSYRIGQVNTPQVLATLFPNYGYRGHVSQWFADAKVNLSLAQLPAGEVKAALGVDARHERFTVDPSAALRSGDIVGNGFSASDAARNVLSVFTEADVPLLTGLSMQAAARLDKFGGVGAHVSPKLALRFLPLPSLLLRGAVEGGFRAPNLSESAESTKYAFDSLADPKRCPQANRLADDLEAAAKLLPSSDPQSTLLQARSDNLKTTECGATVASVVHNNPGLQPETSRNLSFGLVFSPSPRWSLSADAWAILRRNEISAPNTAQQVAAEAAQPPGAVTRAELSADRSFTVQEQRQYGVTHGALQAVTGRFENLPRTRTRGVDLSGKGRQGSPLGTVDMQLDATYLTEYRAWSATRNDWGDNLSGRNGYPRWRVGAGGTLTWGAWAHTLRATATSRTSLHGDYTDELYTLESCASNGYTPAQCQTAGHVRWDYNLAWQLGRQWTLAANLRNVFNKPYPVGVAAWGGLVPPTDEDAKGRLLRLTLEWRLP